MSNQKNKGYRIDYENRTIIVTKEFQKNASDMRRHEYRIMKTLLKDFSDFEVARKEPRTKKSPAPKLTYDKMLQYINRQPDKEILLRDFNEVRFPMDCLKPAPYGVVRKWFILNCPNYNKMTPFDGNGNIIRPEPKAAALAEQAAEGAQSNTAA